jgi:hypothetical protein
VADIIYEFGDTRESRAFWERNAELEPHFDALINLSNKCFGREYQPANRAEDVVFDLGQACRDDFGEVVFLAVHGHGNGAMKLLRGMFERAVTAAYLMKNPEKAERFVRYAAIQEHRMMRATLNVVSEEEFDQAMGEDNTVADIKRRYEEVKPEFETTVCSMWKDAYGWLLGSVGYSLYGASGRRSIPTFLRRRVRHSERADTRYARVNRSPQTTPRKGRSCFQARARIDDSRYRLSKRNVTSSIWITILHR